MRCVASKASTTSTASQQAESISKQLGRAQIISGRVTQFEIVCCALGCQDAVAAEQHGIALYVHLGPANSHSRTIQARGPHRPIDQHVYLLRFRSAAVNPCGSPAADDVSPRQSKTERGYPVEGRRERRGMDARITEEHTFAIKHHGRDLCCRKLHADTVHRWTVQRPA